MKKKIWIMIGLATLLASTTQANQEQLAKSIKDAHAEATRTDAQLKGTLSALNALTQQSKGDLRPAYDTYCAEVVKTEAAAGKRYSDGTTTLALSGSAAYFQTSRKAYRNCKVDPEPGAKPKR